MDTKKRVLTVSSVDVSVMMVNYMGSSDAPGSETVLGSTQMSSSTSSSPTASTPNMLLKPHQKPKLRRKFDERGRAIVVTSDQWVQVTEDSNFTPDIGVSIFQLRFDDAAYVEVISEYAAIHGSTKIIKWLLTSYKPSALISSVANFDACGIDQKLRNNCLVQSCIFGHVENVGLLLDNQADCSFNSGSALCMASKYGHLGCVELLLNANADVHADNDYAICWASRHGHTEVVKRLVEEHADINARRGCPLNWAAEFGSESVTELLIKCGAFVENNENYALRWSSVRGHAKVVRILLQNGADVHAVQDFALRNAVKFRQMDVVKVLLQFGADPSACEDESLKWAVTHQETELIQLLTRHLSPQDCEKLVSAISLEFSQVGLASPTASLSTDGFTDPEE